MVRIKDIAERAGVSTTTVSNVIHQKEGKVSPAVAERIRKLIEEMGYIPSLSAQMLARDSSHIIGVVMGYSPQDALQSQNGLLAAGLIGHLEEAIHRRGYYMMLFTRRSVEEILQESRAWNFDGLIAFNLTQQEIEELHSSYEKPLVLIDSSLERSVPNVCQVSSDEVGGGYQMGRYLLSMGHRRILFIAAGDQENDRLRWMGFRQAMEEAGVVGADAMRLSVSGDREERLAQYGENVPLLRQQTALCFSSDFYAVEAMNWLRAIGLRTPEDLSVTGFDDMLYAKTAWPALTTVHQSLDEKAQAAVRALADMVSGNEPESDDLKIATCVVERDSVREI
ncbi:MAG: LacI family transcriptional regulator [Clostridiales bacterium]|nr:LacI family transcriptional regulator [Clostridiales bacterium]